MLAIASLLTQLEDEDAFQVFTEHRRAFEEFLVNHKMFVNQLVVRHGSMAKGYAPLRDYYRFVLERTIAGLDEAAIEATLGTHEKYQELVKTSPLLTKQAKEFSQAAKTFKLFQDVLSTAFKCAECGARIDKKSMQLDHTEEKQHGGLATTQNASWMHPYCNSTFKRFTTLALASGE